MAKVDPETSALREQLADALAQIDSLQSAAADAEARATSAAERLAAVSGERDAARAEGARLSERLREASLRYRDARLAAAPHIPADLVRGEEMEAIDEEIAAAERVVTEMRERMEREKRQETPAVPAGSPVRRAPDYSGLPAAEKIKVGLKQLSDG
jgi:hypothetical protein